MAHKQVTKNTCT